MIMAIGEKINYFAETDYRGKRIKFGIKEADRARHMYVIGKTGMGKSTLLENLAVQDIKNGEGLCFVDPHGSSAEMLLAYVPESRINDVVYFAPFDQEFPLALNVMEDIGTDKRALVASGLIGAFKKVWVDAWSPRMEYILNNALLALLETPGSTLLGVNRMFSDKAYRDSIVANVKDPSVRAFWLDEYAKYSDRFATEATAAIQNKVGQFAANPLIRNMIGQPKSTFDIRKLMDEKKIFIVNLSKGRIGEGNANLIGSMLITKIYLAAMSRAEIHPTELHKLPAFYLYVDEFQSFANESFADILSEARKYKLALTIAHQYIEQMSEEVRAAVFGNVGTMIAFRVGSYDAEVLEKEFAPQFTAEDMVNLGFAQVYLKLMINGVGSPPFSATTLPRPTIPEPNHARRVIQMSRTQFGRPRADVEKEIEEWHAPVLGSERESSFVPKTKKIAPGERQMFTERQFGGGEQRSRSAGPPRQEGSRPPQERRGESHRPFALAFSQAPDQAIEEGAESPRGTDIQVPQKPLAAYAGVRGKEGQERGVPLNALKSLPKKDKGPTEANLSSLRAALSSVLVTPEKKTGETESGQPRSQAQTPIRSPAPPEPTTAKAPSLATREGRQQAPAPIVPQRIERPMRSEPIARSPAPSVVSPVHQEPKTNANVPPPIPASPRGTYRVGTLPEIPEEVLRKVLEI